MKKQFIAGSMMLASLGVASAQGLYDLAPNDEAKESSPLKWSAGLEIGMDDNVTPTVPQGFDGHEDDVAYARAYVGASLVSLTPQTTWDVFARVGLIHYFDDLEANDADDTAFQGRLNLNFAHRFSERLRFSSRNYIAYETEPDYTYGIAGDAATGEYMHWKSDNAIGYRWTERFATYTGFSARGVSYDNDFDANDRMIYSIYNQFRYQTSEQTIWTFDYKYSWTEADGSAGDSTNQYITLGVEHRFSPNSVLALKAGMQLRDVDDGESEDTPFFEAAVRTRLTEQFSLRAFARYSVEDYGTSFAGGTYDTNKTLRFGLSADYVVSPDLTIHGGANVINSSLEDPRPTTWDDVDRDTLNLYLGFSYKLTEGMFLNGSYNWTDASSDDDAFDYERNRASLGIRMEF